MRLPTTHVIVEYDRTNQVMIDVVPLDFPSDADAEQYARDLNNDGTNCTAYRYERWFRERARA